MGDLSNRLATWWREILQCLDYFYESSLKSSNLAKLSLKLETFAIARLKEDKWGRVKGNIDDPNRFAQVCENRGIGVKIYRCIASVGKMHGLV